MEDKILKTETGLAFRLVKEVNTSWGEYDKTVASTHLASVGWIIIEMTYGTPIDNEYDLELIYKQISKENPADDNLLV